MNRIILASASPRRKELMESLNIPFEIITAEVDETIDPNNPLVDEIEDLSFKKAYAVFKDQGDAIVIGSDTMVVLNDIRLGKPKDEEDAYSMLKALSGNTHEVITAVSIIGPTQSETFSVKSMVKFYPMSDEEILTYIKTGEPMDKAGAYAIQGLGSKFVKTIIGDYYAIMGFPIAEVYHRLNKYLED